MRGHIRPVPADFAQVAPTMGVKALQTHYVTGCETLKRWIRESGINALPARRPCPPDIAERAATMTRRRMMKHYSVNARTMARWLIEAKVVTFVKRATRGFPVPADFAERVAAMTAADLARHYAVHNRTVARWLRITGLVAVKYVQPRRAAPIRVAGYRRMTGVEKRSYAAVNALRRDDSLEGRAADHLRRFAAVYRCTERGGVVDDRKALTHWRYGQVVLDGDELVERAMRRGWAPDGWRALAGQSVEARV